MRPADRPADMACRDMLARTPEAFEARVASPAFTHGHRGAVAVHLNFRSYDIEVAVSRSSDGGRTHAHIHECSRSTFSRRGEALHFPSNFAPAFQAVRILMPCEPGEVENDSVGY